VCSIINNAPDLTDRVFSSTTNGRVFHAAVVSSHVTAKNHELECGPLPNVMAALPNIGGALCSTPQSLADAHY